MTSKLARTTTTVKELREQMGLTLESISPTLNKMGFPDVHDDLKIKTSIASNLIKAKKQFEAKQSNTENTTQNENEPSSITEVPKAEIRSISRSTKIPQKALVLLGEELQAQSIQLLVESAYLQESRKEELEAAEEIGKSIAKLEKTKNKLADVQQELANVRAETATDINQIALNTFGFSFDSLENKVKEMEATKSLQGKIDVYRQSDLTDDDIRKLLLEEGYNTQLVDKYFAKKNMRIISDLQDWL